jgi:hypothetical protein
MPNPNLTIPTSEHPRLRLWASVVTIINYRASSIVPWHPHPRMVDL